jgi:radical SAM protein with 4Fe4S-binding SPASM domain
MSNLMAQLTSRAAALEVPLTVHLDLTYRCNERCEHCYLDHDDRGELSFSEIAALLHDLAAAGTLFLTLSGGEALLRRDFFDIVALARSLAFSVRVKTNAVLLRPRDAERLRALGVHEVQVSLYSHRPEVHDAVTKVPGSFFRTVAGIGALRAAGVPVVVANVLMRRNFADYKELQALAARLGASCTVDPTVTPHIGGDRTLLAFNVSAEDLRAAFHDPGLVGPVETACAPPQPPGEDVMDALPCSAGHSACYVSPYGDVYPCVQFPLPTGNIRQQPFASIWHHSPAFAEVRSIRVADLPTCSTCSHLGSCTRCPGLAYMEGSMRGPSGLDCAKSFARTGVPTAGMLAATDNGQTRTAAGPGLHFIPVDRVQRSS